MTDENAKHERREVDRIELSWRFHPDRVLESRELWVPGVEIRLQSDKIYGLTPAVLAPYAVTTVLPISIARELDLDVFELPSMEDPLLPLQLRYWTKRPVEIYGKLEGEYLRVELDLAFDVAERTFEAMLGQQFFHQVRLVLDGDLTGESYIQSRPPAH